MTTPTPKAMDVASTFINTTVTPCFDDRLWEYDSGFIKTRLALAIDAAVEEAVKAEREACALICLERAIKFKHAGDNLALPSVLAIVPQTRAIEAETLATAIRARGAS